MEATSKTRFSLVRGGLFYHLERRLRLMDDQNLGLPKRVIVFWCLTWVPIMILELIRLLAPTGALPLYAFYSDISISIRFLFSGALLIGSEGLIEYRLGLVIAEFQSRTILDSTNSLSALLSNAKRSITGTIGTAVEAILLALTLSIGFYSVQSLHLGPYQDWKPITGVQIPTTLVWYIGIALPLFRFLQLRWLWRFYVWVKLLWGISKLRMNLVATHPDSAGGLGFIAIAQEAFAPLWVAISAGSASMIAFRVIHLHEPLSLFYVPIGVLVATETLLLILPTLFFMPRLFRLRRSGLLNYGRFSSRYVLDFDRKWLRSEYGLSESPLGTADIQSLADMGNSFDRVVNTRILPIGPSTVILIVLASTLPFLPLALLLVPVDEIAHLLVKMLT